MHGYALLRYKIISPNNVYVFDNIDTTVCVFIVNINKLKVNVEHSVAIVLLKTLHF